MSDSQALKKSESAKGCGGFNLHAIRVTQISQVVLNAKVTATQAGLFMATVGERPRVGRVLNIQTTHPSKSAATELRNSLHSLLPCVPRHDSTVQTRIP